MFDNQYKKGKKDMSTMQLQQSVLQDVISLLDDNEAMKKLQKYISRLRSEKEAQESMSAKEKQEVLEDVKEGLRELKLMKQGKLKSRSIEELLLKYSVNTLPNFDKKFKRLAKKYKSLKSDLKELNLE